MMEEEVSRASPRDLELEPGVETVLAEASEEAHVPRRLPTPLLPSKEEIDEHAVVGHGTIQIVVSTLRGIASSWTEAFVCQGGCNREAPDP